MRTYRELCGVAEFRVLFAARCLIVGGYSFASLALGTLAYAETGSPVLTAFVMFGGPLVRLLAAPYLLSLADLWRPRTALAAGAGVNAVSMGVQAIPDLPIVVRLVLLTVPWVLTSATVGATPALVADILPEGSYVFGRATLNIATGVMQISGYGLSGVLLAVMSTSPMFLGVAFAELIVVALVLRGLRDHPPRAEGTAVARSRAVNRVLLQRSSGLRPVFLAMWVPPGLIVGCESLLVPYAGDKAGLVFAAGALGMLAGDVAMGRFVAPGRHQRWFWPAQWLLPLPWLLFVLEPGWVTACLLVAAASFGFCATLPLQERLVERTADDLRGHALGLQHLGMMGGQGVGALVGGALATALATALGSDRDAAGVAMTILAAAALLVTAALVPGLRRTGNDPTSTVVALDHGHAG